MWNISLVFKTFLFLVFFTCISSLSAKYNSILLDKNKDELIIYYNIPSANYIEIDSHYDNILIKGKTFTTSMDGKFKITLNIKSEVSREFYDPLRVYSNGEFLLYKDYLLPKTIRYENGTVVNKIQDTYPNFSILENDEYILGNRYIFWGDEKPIKILGLEKNRDLKENILKVYKEVFNYYSNVFGHIIKKKPVVVIDFTENGGDFHYKGDVLDDFLSYNVLNVSKLDKGKYHQIYSFIAHEIFHIWNSYEHNHFGKSWLHEGSAEYFSIKSLFKLGYVDAHKVESIQRAYLNACYRYYKDNSKKIMNENNSDFSIYVCGNALHILLEKLENENIVLDIWKILFKDSSYNSDDFIYSIKKQPSIKKETIARIYDFIYREGGVVRSIELLSGK
ncbi:hypothetical protein A1D25_02730 [Ursidibacter arcticus]|uniref:hypothetical protein n=1 Tax=Ursidibacter arcticus TaxID=1524965 RepID=UPI0012F7A41A|nr:hypothetical protein [Ursidibacter arcticus]KAE9537117.1 hypothetical protein A1D25_02730 [Ursidibacter arcticus]